MKRNNDAQWLAVIAASGLSRRAAIVAAAHNADRGPEIEPVAEELRL